MDAFAKILAAVTGAVGALAGVPAAFTGIAKVIAAVAALLGGLWYVKTQIAETATAKAGAHCEVRIAAIQSTQSTEADTRVETADDAAEALARADTRADLRRVCQGDPACRDRPN